MKKTMIATVLGLALLPLTFAAQTPAKKDEKPATSQSTATENAKPAVKKPVKKHHKKVNKTGAAATTPNSNAPAAPASAPKK